MQTPSTHTPPSAENATADATTSLRRAPAFDESGLPDSYLRMAVLDAAGRMRTGLVAYPALWILLMPVNGFAQSHPWMAWGNAVGLILFSLMRYRFNERVLPAMLDEHLNDGRHLFRLLSIFYNLYWGILCAMVMLSPDSGDLRWLLMMSTVGITASGTVNIALDSVLPRYHASCTLGPSVISLLPLGGTVNLAVMGLFIVLIVYARGMSRLVAREYWGRLHNQFMLEEHARELEKLSRTDALTQVANRLRFQEAMAHAWRDACRRQESLAVVIIDLDHFKRINDTYGHPFGDRCLRAAAQALTEAVRRPYDLVARYGGEEFAVLLPNTSLENAEMMAQRMLQHVCAVSLVHEEAPVRVSCSIGVASTRPMHGQDPEWLLRQAAAALYQAKQNGRSRVVVHHEPAASIDEQALTGDLNDRLARHPA